jgi:predicted AAA+ superfamily ATPase
MLLHKPKFIYKSIDPLKVSFVLFLLEKTKIRLQANTFYSFKYKIMSTVLFRLNYYTFLFKCEPASELINISNTLYETWLSLFTIFFFFFFLYKWSSNLKHQYVN